MRTSRRAVLLALAGAFLLPGVAVAQQRKRVVLTGFDSMFPGDNGLEEVVRQLARRGVVEGRQIEVHRVVIEPLRDDAQLRGLDYLVPKIREKVLPLKPDVIVTVGSIMAKGAQLATRTVPIVASIADPVHLGVAQSLARPGGNVTGVTAGVGETSAKVVEFMKVLVPRLARVAIFHDPRPVAARFANLYENAVRGAGLEPVMIASMVPAELIAAIRGLPARQVQAGIWTFADGDRATIAREATAVRLPMVGVNEEDAESGCLASFSAAGTPPHPQMAEMVEQILRGANPATMPFHYPTTFRLVINRRTATAIGLKVPPDLLIRADRVIE